MNFRINLFPHSIECNSSWNKCGTTLSQKPHSLHTINNNNKIGGSSSSRRSARQQKRHILIRHNVYTNSNTTTTAEFASWCVCMCVCVRLALILICRWCIFGHHSGYYSRRLPWRIKSNIKRRVAQRSYTIMGFFFFFWYMLYASISDASEYLGAE